MSVRDLKNVGTAFNGDKARETREENLALARNFRKAVAEVREENTRKHGGRLVRKILRTPFDKSIPEAIIDSHMAYSELAPWMHAKRLGGGAPRTTNFFILDDFAFGDALDEIWDSNARVFTGKASYRMVEVTVEPYQ